MVEFQEHGVVFIASSFLEFIVTEWAVMLNMGKRSYSLALELFSENVPSSKTNVMTMMMTMTMMMVMIAVAL